MKKAITLFIFLCLYVKGFSQIDSLAKDLIDTVKSRLIVDAIPRKTVFDKLMYPHRWYVKQLLAPKQIDLDSNYVKNHKHKLTVTIPLSKKFYGFNINDLNTGKTMKFSPNNYYHVGFNFSNIIVTFGFAPGIKFGAKPGRGNTKSTDLQVTAIGRHVITDINIQNYSGFYLYNTRDYQLPNPNPDTFVVRPDINVFSFGVNTHYVFNYKKYSLRGAFSFTDVQRKSAGSFLAGAYHSHVEFRTTDSFIVQPAFRPEFSSKVNSIQKTIVITAGISGGYGYTFVYRKIIYCMALNIGVGIQRTDYRTFDEKHYKLPFYPAAKLNAKGAIRYDNLRFFVGALASYDNNYTFNEKVLKTENYMGRIVFFVGYRFNIKQNGYKVLKALKLVGY